MEFPNNRIVVKRPSLWIINLNDDSLVRRFEIPVNLVETGRGLVSLTVDDPNGSCQDSFAYITDWFTSNLIVYSLTQNKAWVVDHNYFHFDPVFGAFNVGGFQFNRRDGLFSVALSHRLKDGFKIAFFHAMCSDAEFVVSTEILRNETLATRTFHGKDFKVIADTNSYFKYLPKVLLTHL
jgi:dopachrome tautomerase